MSRLLHRAINLLPVVGFAALWVLDSALIAGVTLFGAALTVCAFDARTIHAYQSATINRMLDSVPGLEETVLAGVKVDADVLFQFKLGGPPADISVQTLRRQLTQLGSDGLDLAAAASASGWADASAAAAVENQRPHRRHHQPPRCPQTSRLWVPQRVELRRPSTPPHPRHGNITMTENRRVHSLQRAEPTDLPPRPLARHRRCRIRHPRIRRLVQPPAPPRRDPPRPTPVHNPRRPRSGLLPSQRHSRPGRDSTNQASTEPGVIHCVGDTAVLEV